MIESRAYRELRAPMAAHRWSFDVPAGHSASGSTTTLRHMTRRASSLIRTTADPRMCAAIAREETVTFVRLSIR